MAKEVLDGGTEVAVALQSLDAHGALRFSATLAPGPFSYDSEVRIGSTILAWTQAALFGVSTDDGGISWRSDIGGIAKVIASGAGPALVQVVGDSSTGSTYFAIDPLTGRVLWSRSYQWYSFAVANAQGEAAISSGTGFAPGAPSGELDWVEPDGSLAWAMPNVQAAPVAMVNDVAYVVEPDTRNGLRLAAFRKDGTHAELEPDGGWALGGLVADQSGAVALESRDLCPDAAFPCFQEPAYLRRFDATGSLIWASSLDDSGTQGAGLALLDGGLLVLTASNETVTGVRAYDLDASLLWSCGLPDAGGSGGYWAVALGPGRVYLQRGTTPLEVYALPVDPPASGWLGPTGDFRNASSAR